MGLTQTVPCPLCQSEGTEPFHQDSNREYLRCSHCELVFVPEPFLPTPAEEKAHYDLHENSPEDTGYRQFLNRLAEPLTAKISTNAVGLDFGSGPGPTLSVMLEERGYPMQVFDPIYAPNPDALNASYDFITATEVVEHLHRPGNTLETLHALLRPGGWLGIMTKRVLSREAFRSWHYIQDPTHVCFWSEHTFRWLAGHWRAHVEFPAADVVLLQIPGANSDPVLP